jgi:hypothetical protein
MSQPAQRPIRHSTANQSGVMMLRRSLDQTMSMTGDINGSVSHEATVRPTTSELHKYIKRESNCFHTFIGTSEPDHGDRALVDLAREGSMTGVLPSTPARR